MYRIMPSYYLIDILKVLFSHRERGFEKNGYESCTLSIRLFDFHMHACEEKIQRDMKMVRLVLYVLLHVSLQFLRILFGGLIPLTHALQGLCNHALECHHC